MQGPRIAVLGHEGGDFPAAPRTIEQPASRRPNDIRDIRCDHVELVRERDCTGHLRTLAQTRGPLNSVSSHRFSIPYEGPGTTLPGTTTLPRSITADDMT